MRWERSEAEGAGAEEEGGREGSAEPRRVRRRGRLEPARPLGSWPRPRSASPTRLYNLERPRCRDTRNSPHAEGTAPRGPRVMRPSLLRTY